MFYNRKNSLLSILLIWTLGILVSIPFTIQAEYTENRLCQLNMNIKFLAYIILLYGSIIFIPTILLSFLYIYIIVQLHKHGNKLNQDNLTKLQRLYSNNYILNNYSNNREKKNSSSASKKSSQNNNSWSSNYYNKNNNNQNIYNNPIKDMPNSMSHLNRIQKIPIHNNSTTLRTYDTDQASYHSASFLLCSICCFLNPRKKYKCKFRLNKMNQSHQNINNKNMITNINRNEELEENNSFIENNNNNDENLNNINLINNQANLIMNNNNFRNMNISFDLLNKISLTNISNNLTLNSHAKRVSNKINFTIILSIITLIFFLCQLPIRIFLLWSFIWLYRNSNEYDFVMDKTLVSLNSSTTSNNYLFSQDSSTHLTDIISNITTLIFFLHCISNPIIYNLASAKFRKTFLSLTTFKSLKLFKISFRMPDEVKKV